MFNKIFKKEGVQEQDADGEVIVRLAKDEMKASILVKAPSGSGYVPELNDGYEALRKKGIQYGLDDQLLIKIFENKAFDKEILIAKGDEFIQTKQGKLKYYFKTEPTLKPLEDKKGNLDFKNVKLIQNVKKGDKVCELIPPEKGKAGKTITGKGIQPEDVKEIRLPGIVNGERDPNNKNILVASIDGTVRKSEDVIEVNPVLSIKSHVDYSTGNIESDISTKIAGDVKSTFKVNTSADLEVTGVIEDAEIYAGGGIVARSGILGKGNGKIVAGGSISARNCQKATLISKKDIVLSERVSDSVIISDGMVKIKARKSEIQRCKIIAKDGVEVRNIGNDNYEHVEVVVGMPGEVYLERESLAVRLRQFKEKVGRTEKDLRLANKMKHFKGGSVNKDTIAKLQQDYSDIKRQYEEMKAKKKELDAQIQSNMNHDASLMVFGKIYPGVLVNVCNKKLKVMEEKTLVEYTSNADEENVIEGDLKEKYSKMDLQRMMLRG